MRNVTYVGLCWSITLGLVAVALGQQQSTKTGQNGPQLAPQTVDTMGEPVGRGAPAKQTTGLPADFVPVAANADERQRVANQRSDSNQLPMPGPDASQNRSVMTNSNQPLPAPYGEQPRGELGVWMAANDGPGVRILRVTPGSAAEQAGLRVGDFVLQVNGRGASSPQKAAQMIRQIPIGQSGTLTVWRDGDQQELQVMMQPARDRGRDIASNMGREVNRDSYQVGLPRDEESTGGDSSSRIKRLEQQIGSLTQELAAMRQEMAQLRSAGSVQTTGFNTEAHQGSTPRPPSTQNTASPSNAALAPTNSTNAVAPAPGFEKAGDTATNSPAEPPKSAAPAAAPAEPAKPAAPAAPAEKPAASDPFGSASPPPKNEDKPKSEDKPKAEDKGTDDLFK